MNKQIDYGVYVIELNNNPMEIYVGQSYLLPQERLEQHLKGIHSSRVVRKAKSAKLRPDLYGRYERVDSRVEAEELEIVATEYFTRKGFKVHGGH